MDKEENERENVGELRPRLPDSFAYDGENRRIYSKESGVQLVNLYDIFGNLISQYSPGSPFFTTDYVWANGEPRMRIDTLTSLGLGPLAPGGPTETPYWYHTDHLGTPYVLTDTLKAIQWQISLDPFGETVSETITGTSDNLRFPGQYADRESGLNYNWHRYYQPKIGRYYQVDPEFMQASTTPYAFVSGNPIKLTDRTGTATDVNIEGCGKRKEKIIQAIKVAVNTAKRCLKDFSCDVDYFTAKANTQKFICTNKSSQYCGQTISHFNRTVSDTTFLSNDAFNNREQCGILPSVIFHEILHTYSKFAYRTEEEKKVNELKIKRITGSRICFGDQAAPIPK